MPSNWKSLENHVRGIAQLRWSEKCIPEHIDGVDFDGVVRVSADEIIIIEITEERSLDKVRGDINKILPIKIRLATEGIICRAFVVIDSEPTNSMKEAGKASHITVLSSTQFEQTFFDFNTYNQLRKAMPFGSAVDSKTGTNDPRPFIPVRYSESNRANDLSINDLTTRLLRKAHIALTGDFGTGKSRCVRELYEKLAAMTREAGAFPVAINLRDHWSSSNALEVLAGHLGNTGLSASIDNFIRLLNAGNLILLLDGFDEIGAQSYDTRVDDRKSLRRHAVRGVRDLIQKSNAGILVTGRSHFFDSDEEMLQSLGMLNAKGDSMVLHVPDSLTPDEAKSYLDFLGIFVSIPPWLPRKPLVFQILAELHSEDVSRVLSQPHGEFEFWGTFINAACVREAKGVADSIAPQTIKLILLELAAKSRHSTHFLGRLTPRDIDEAYEIAVGSAPDQTGRQLLARMCTLGRIEPESPDRQYVDSNVVDVLRAERLVQDIVALRPDDTQILWKQSLRTLGAVHAAYVVDTFDLEQLCFSFLRKFGHTANTKRLGEIISVLTIYGSERIDFQGLQISHAEIPILNLVSRLVMNLNISDSVINIIALDRTPIDESSALEINNCLLTLAVGVSSQTGLPSWIKDSEVVEFDRLSNAARIKESPLLPSQKLFLSIIHKIFFQSGGGREEASLSKGGYGQKYSPKLVDAILRLLLRDKVVERFKGDDGYVYTPVRRFAERMNKIRSELTLCEDPLWVEVSGLK